MFLSRDQQPISKGILVCLLSVSTQVVCLDGRPRNNDIFMIIVGIAIITSAVASGSENHALYGKPTYTAGFRRGTRPLFEVEPSALLQGVTRRFALVVPK